MAELSEDQLSLIQSKLRDSVDFTYLSNEDPNRIPLFKKMIRTRGRMTANPNWEKLLLGTVYFCTVHPCKRRKTLSVEDFELPQHRLIWKHIVELSKTNALSEAALIERIRRRGPARRPWLGNVQGR